jgi:hypothetical protein
MTKICSIREPTRIEEEGLSPRIPQRLLKTSFHFLQNGNSNPGQFWVYLTLPGVTEVSLH